MSEDGAEVLSSKKVPEMASSFNVSRLPLKIRKALRHLLDFILALFLAATMHPPRVLRGVRFHLWFEVERIAPGSRASRRPTLPLQPLEDRQPLPLCRFVPLRTN